MTVMQPLPLEKLWCLHKWDQNGCTNLSISVPVNISMPHLLMWGRQCGIYLKHIFRIWLPSSFMLIVTRLKSDIGNHESLTSRSINSSNLAFALCPLLFLTVNVETPHMFLFWPSEHPLNLIYVTNAWRLAFIYLAFIYLLRYFNENCSICDFI